MERVIVYPQEIPLAEDWLRTNQFAMIGLGRLAAVMLGTSSVVFGLNCAQTTIASLGVNIAPGEIYAYENVDDTAYSSLPANTSQQIVKQGHTEAVTLSTPAPTVAGTSINYLVQASFSEVDGTSTTLDYYNASNPNQPYTGPNNSGTTQPTVRSGTCAVTIKAGVAATTGSQATPTPDANNVGLWVVTVANGQTTVTSTNISLYANAPFIPAGGLKGMLSDLLQRFTNLSVSDVAGAASLTTVNSYRGNFKACIGVTDNYTIDATNGFGIFYEFTGGAGKTITVPPLASHSGGVIAVYNPTTNSVTLATTSPNVINNVAASGGTLTIAPGAAYILATDGSSLSVIASNTGGPQGIQGPKGDTGAAGTNGTNGNSVLHGTTDPTSGVGANGDFYINTSTNTIWGPKAGGAWPGSGVSLVGANVLVSSGTSASSWYRVWSDGTIEQGGMMTGGPGLTGSVSYSHNLSTISGFSISPMGTNAQGDNNDAFVATPGTTSLTYKFDTGYTGLTGFGWSVIGK